MTDYMSREDYCEETCGKENREGYKACTNCGMLNVPTADVPPMKRCRMIPLEPDCRGYTDTFICTNCHQHIHLGFIRKEYSGSFCIECGAEMIKDDEIDG